MHVNSFTAIYFVVNIIPFLSLRIHVPWASLTASPVEITLSGMECVVTDRRHDAVYMSRARMAAAAAAASAAHDAHAATEPVLEAEELKRAAKSQGVSEAEADEGWVQSLITRIGANVSLIINDISIKYNLVRSRTLTHITLSMVMTVPGQSVCVCVC